MPFRPGAGGGYNRVHVVVYTPLRLLIEIRRGERNAFDYAKKYWPAYLGDNFPKLQTILKTLVGLPDTIYNSVDARELQNVIIWLKVRTSTSSHSESL